MTDFSDQNVEDLLLAGLTEGDAVIGTLAPILRHMLANSDNTLFSDEVLARVRGMLGHIARQLVGTDEAADGRRADDLAEALLSNNALLTHLHALALEWQLAERLHAQAGIDPVLSPLLQALIASSNPGKAGAAMTALAAQARFMQNVRRMELHVSELPGELFHEVLLALRTSTQTGALEEMQAWESYLRSTFDESRTRIALLAQLVTGMGGGAIAGLSLGHAGVAIFLSALAIGSGQDRELAVLATTERQYARLALGLRAAGLKKDAVKEQLFTLHPDLPHLGSLGTIRSKRAAALLADSDLRSEA